jgi:superfamily II DNA/RNA helicase
MADNMVHKNRLLESLLGSSDLKQAVVFTATKRSAEEVSLSLQEKGFSAAALHGDMHQTARNRTLDKLRQGRIGVLVATDVAARGIDVAGISHVINFDAPRQAEDYVHRIGRTGRAGRDGIAITFSGPREMGIIRAIERYTGDRLAVHVIEGLEPTSRPSSPRRLAGGGGGKPGFGGGRPSGGSSWGRGDSRDARPGANKGWSSDAPSGSRGGYGRDATGGGRSEGSRFGGDRPEGARRPRPAARG